MEEKKQSSNQENKKSVYCAAPELPTQEAVDGIKYDFCDGLRLKFPKKGGPWRVEIIDGNTGNIMYDEQVVNEQFIATKKKWFIPYLFRISKDGKSIYEHVYETKDKVVLIQLPVPTLGDSIAWLGPAIRFKDFHECNLYIYVNKYIKELFEKEYPDIHFISDKKEVEKLKPYAEYYVGLFFNDPENNLTPSNFRLYGLHHQAAHILDVNESEEPPKLTIDCEREIKEPYVCIATKASMQCKLWNNPKGWTTVIDALKKKGFRVLCIDKDKDECGTVPNPMPRGCEDFTGNIPLIERAKLLKHASFFIGLPSGLSWLAWCCRTPVVLLGGFSEPFVEFFTPYRIINRAVCTGCWNDISLKFEHGNYMWCPRQTGTFRQFECTRLISPQQVLTTIDILIDNEGIKI